MGPGDALEVLDREGAQAHQGIDVQPIHQVLHKLTLTVKFSQQQP